MIAAILQAQWLSARFRLRVHDKGALFSAATTAIFYGLWTFAAVAAAEYFAQPLPADRLQTTLTSGLLIVSVYWQLAPVISASLGTSLELRKLLVYPIPHRTLFGAELLLRITSLAEMPLVVIGAAIGLARNPRTTGLTPAAVFAGALTFIAMNVVLAAGVRHAIERIFLRTRMREVLLLVLALAGVLPQLLIMAHLKAASLARFVPRKVVWPWSAVADFMLGESLAGAIPLALLYLAVCWWFGWRQFLRSLRSDASDLRKREREKRGAGPAEFLLRLPSRFLDDPLAALLEKELRTFGRVTRFRFVYGMSCLFGLIFYLPWTNRRAADSFLGDNALPVMALYGLLMLGQISYWNSFGFDRAAVQGYFVWPIRLRDALIAKNLAVGALILPQVIVISIAGRLFGLPSSSGKIAETMAVALIAGLYWCALGNIASVRMPRPLDPDKLNQMSNRLQTLSILASPVLLLPVGLAYWAREVLASEWLFGALLVFAAVVGAVFYWVALDSSVTRAVLTRESIVALLSQGEGPLSTS